MPDYTPAQQEYILSVYPAHQSAVDIIGRLEAVTVRLVAENTALREAVEQSISRELAASWHRAIARETPPSRKGGQG